MKKSILITGAAGFLGSHLCDRFIRRGFYVYALDNFHTGNLRNIQHLLPLSQFELRREDVTDFNFIPGHLDYIIHLASPSLIDFRQQPLRALKACAAGVQNCLDLAKNKSARILIASASEVYGFPVEHACSEDDPYQIHSAEAESIYQQARLHMESITAAYQLFANMETRIARLFFTYGPRMRLDEPNIIASSMHQVVHDQQLSIDENSSADLSCCYIDDVVEGIYRLLLSDYHLPVNIGNPKKLSARDIVSCLQLVTKQYNLPQRPAGKTERTYVPDIFNARQFLNWLPAIPIREGLSKTYSYFHSLQKELSAINPKDAKHSMQVIV